MRISDWSSDVCSSDLQVATDIQEKLGAYVRDPQVAVILTDLRSHEYLSRVRVTGAVRQPISIPHRPGMTVLDAVLAAGGVNEFAAPDRSSLYRRSDSSEGRRVGKEGVSTCKYWWSPSL